MDVLGVQQTKIKKHAQKRCAKGVKVVYISTPMKVKTCASNFRALVQELTGKDSDADAAALRFSNVSGIQTSTKSVDHCGVSEDGGNFMNSPTISDVATESFGDWLMSQRVESFFDMFTS